MSFSVVFAFMAIALTGCGSLTSSKTLLGKVEKTHTLTIAESAFAPEDFQNPKTHQWTGYDVNILRGFAKTLGAHLKMDPMPFSASIQAVESKRTDITIDIFYTAARAKIISFSRPMLNYTNVVVVNSQHPAVSSATLSGLKGKKIAVQLGSAQVPEAQKVPQAIVKQYSSVVDSFLVLSDGRVAAVFAADAFAAWAKKQNPSLHIKILGTVPPSISPPIASIRGYYGVPKGAYTRSFRKKLNAYLKKIASDGQEQKILDKYGMSNPVFLQGISSASNTYNNG